VVPGGVAVHGLALDAVEHGDHAAVRQVADGRVGGRGRAEERSRRAPGRGPLSPWSSAAESRLARASTATSASI
jgi:hypothetical protein